MRPWQFTRRLGPAAALVTAIFLGSGCGEDSTPPATPAAPPPATPPPTEEPTAPMPAAVPEEVAAWLDANVQPFDGSHLSLPHTDIEFLRDLVGDARIVALGENTHGTRDFFEMKARVLRFLVEEMGFDTFAIEASWPEAMRIDRYVRTGEGDSAVLLAGLYYWTWNTESVLEMIEWMREHNEAGGDIGFHGVDMNHPGMPLHIVREFIRFVDPARLSAVTAELDCLDRFAQEPDGSRPADRYRNQTDAYLAECGAALEGVREVLEANRERYEIAGGADTYAIARQSMRVALQYHWQTTGEQFRDESMADNTIWLSERMGPESRTVLWAHNFHVSTQPEAQGHYLREVFGDDMVVIGFSHERGRFTAVSLTRGLSGLRELELDPPLPNSFEAYLGGASAPRFLLDLRGTADEPGGEWLAEPRRFRHIGCCFGTDRPAEDFYFAPASMPDWFDAIIHFESTRPTVLLPRRLPTTW